MADPEHLAILKQGVEAWNAWRRQYPDVLPDLRKADLPKADLDRVNLRNADLGSADLTGAKLRGADLEGAGLAAVYLYAADLRSANLNRAFLGGAELDEAKLHGADLRGADLQETQLIGVNLLGADLRGAFLGKAYLVKADLRWANLAQVNLSRADLDRANLSGAHLDGTNMTEAVLRETVFGDVDMSSCIGLENCEHRGRSVIDHRTLQRSGSLPLAFLRGVGLPENLIEYLPSLLNQAIRMYSCFISYSTKDEDFAQRLHADLQNKGVRCWFAPHDLRIGDKIRPALDEAVRLHEKLLLVLSENSIASTWVEKEVETAFERERETGATVLFPVRLDNTVMDVKIGWAADIKRSRHIGDFRQWKDHDAYAKTLERLLRDLQVTKA